MAQQYDHKREWREFYGAFIDGFLQAHPEVGQAIVDEEREAIEVFQAAGLDQRDWEWAR